MDTSLAVKKYRFARAVRRYTPILIAGGAVVGENLGTKAELGPGTMVEKLAESDREDEIAKNGVVEAGE